MLSWLPDLFLFCYERDFISLSDDKQVDIIEAFNTTSRNLDDILNSNNAYLVNMVSQIHLRNLLTHTLLFWHFLKNLNFEFKNILEYIRTMLSGNT